MTAMGFFSRTLFANRFEFIVISLMGIYACQLILNMVWGHFYSRKTLEPSQVQMYYSTAHILGRLSFGQDMKKQLKQQADTKLNELTVQLADTSISYLPKNILNSAKEEKSLLEQAQTYLG